MPSHHTNLPAQTAAISLKIPHASPAWKLIMQSGALLPCTVGITLSELLHSELGLSAAQLAPVDAFILDGMPVDEPEQTIVPDNARLALACALPGIAGLAMKKGSAVRGLRSGITHRINEAPCPRPGRISLSLYSLTLDQLAAHFLGRGIQVEPAQIIRYARFAPGDTCRLSVLDSNVSSIQSKNNISSEVKADDLEKILSEQQVSKICLFTAKIAE